MQVMDIVDRLFVAMFDSLNENCKKELEAIERQYPFEPLKVIILLKLKFSSIHVRDIAFYIMKKLVECSLHGCGFFYRPMVFFFSDYWRLTECAVLAKNFTTSISRRGSNAQGNRNEFHVPITSTITYTKFSSFTIFLVFAIEFNLFLQEVGMEVDPYGDLNTEAERKLGQLVLEK